MQVQRRVKLEIYFEIGALPTHRTIVVVGNAEFLVIGILTQLMFGHVSHALNFWNFFQ